MRTNIDIDDKLLAKAMVASGKTTKKDTVHEALELLVRVRQGQAALKRLRGKIEWEATSMPCGAADVACRHVGVG